MTTNSTELSTNGTLTASNATTAGNVTETGVIVAATTAATGVGVATVALAATSIAAIVVAVLITVFFFLVLFCIAGFCVYQRRKKLIQKNSQKLFNTPAAAADEPERKKFNFSTTTDISSNKVLEVSTAQTADFIYMQSAMERKAQDADKLLLKGKSMREKILLLNDLQLQKERELQMETMMER